MNIAVRLPRRSILVLVVLSAGCLLWLPRQQRISQLQRKLDQARAEFQTASQQIASATQELESRRREIDRLNQVRDRVRASAFHAGQKLAAANPDAYWSQPPANWPDWNASSPYVWMHKSILPQLKVECFGDDGRLQPEVAQVLTIPKDQLNELNAKLSDLIGDYRGSEASRAYRTNSPGNETDANRITIQIDAMADEGRQLVKELEATLLDSLGRQRTDLLMEGVRSRFERQLSEFGKQSKTITVERRADGTTSIAIRHSGYLGSQSLTMPVNAPFDSPGNPIPPNLLPLFNDLWIPNQQPAAAAP